MTGDFEVMRDQQSSWIGQFQNNLVGVKNEQAHLATQIQRDIATMRNKQSNLTIQVQRRLAHSETTYITTSSEGK